MSNESQLLTLLSKQIEYCKAQDYTDTETAQAIIDTAADWFEDSLNQVGMSPAMIPNLLRWQAHQHEYLS